MIRNDNIVAFSTKQRQVELDAKLKAHVARCREVVGRGLPGLMNGLFERLDDALYELADKSNTSEMHDSYFEAMRQVRMKREHISRHFAQRVLQEYDRFWKQGPRTAGITPGPTGQEVDSDFDDGAALSLMDDTDLEQTLAVSNMVSKGENRFQRPLLMLNLRFARMLQLEQLESAQNPLGPRVVCDSFHASMSDFKLDMPVLLVIYKLFDKFVMSHVGGLYDELNALLGSAGIQPKKAFVGSRQLGQRRTSEARERESRQPLPTAAQESQDQPDYAEETAQLFESVRGMLADYRQRIGVPVYRGNLPQVDMGELMSTLSQLQSDWGQSLRYGDHGLSLPVDLRDQLKASLQLERNGELSRELGRHENDAVDVIGMLFDFFLEDPNLPDAMKALIARLQIPMLKVAIMDKAFFSRKQHPARRLLNDLGRAAVAWSDDGDRSKNSLYGRIESVVERVVENFEDDAGVFEQLHQEFSGFIEREKRGARIAEERTNQVSRGKEQLSLAKMRVADEIHALIGTYKRLPSVSMSILHEGWQDVLLLTFLRQGTESSVWESQLKTARMLLWSVQPKMAQGDRQKLLRAIPDLLQSLREALNSISYDQHKMARMFKELQACHIASLRGSEGPQTVTVADYLQDADSEFRFADPMSAETVPLMPSGPGDKLPNDRYSRQAEMLKVGDWLQLDDEDEHQQRVKLSWKSDVSDCYVFVNRRGIKVRELTLFGVAKLFRDAKASLLEQVDAPIMDRAMNAMVKNLKSA